MCEVPEVSPAKTVCNCFWCIVKSSPVLHGVAAFLWFAECYCSFWRVDAVFCLLQEKRRKVINTVRRHWEKAQHEKKDEHHAKHANNVPIMDLSRDVVIGNEILTISSGDHPDNR